jgi:hypothetical protein
MYFRDFWWFKFGFLVNNYFYDGEMAFKQVVLFRLWDGKHGDLNLKVIMDIIK